MVGHSSHHRRDSLAVPLPQGTRLATEIHSSRAGALLLQADGQMLSLDSLEATPAPRGHVLGLAAGPTYLHLDAGEFLVTWPNSTETLLTGLERVRSGAFACDAERCYLIDANTTHSRLLGVSANTAIQVQLKLL